MTSSDTSPRTLLTPKRRARLRRYYMRLSVGDRVSVIARGEGGRFYRDRGTVTMAGYWDDAGRIRAGRVEVTPDTAPPMPARALFLADDGYAYGGVFRGRVAAWIAMELWRCWPALEVGGSARRAKGWWNREEREDER